MKIGFDISQTGRTKAGCGYFAHSLIRHLAVIDSENEYILYPTFGDLYWDPDWKSSTCRIDAPKFRRGKGHRNIETSRLFWSNPPDDLEDQLENPDIIHSNNFFCPTGLRNARLFYTLYDLSFLDHPEWHLEANRIGCFDGTFNASLYADFIFAISEYSRHHFLETFPHFPAERIRVVHLGSRFSERLNLSPPIALPQLQPNRFWLNVGTIEPRKNQDRLLKAYARLKAQEREVYPLVLAGGSGWLMEEFGNRLENLGLRQDVIITGYIDDTSLQWLYENCFALVYPSLFEGFGLPVLEAMSLGAPVIASNTTSIPEIVGSAGILVDPLDEEAIFQAMLKLSSEPQTLSRLRDMGLKRSKLFTWEAAAQSVLECYRSAPLKIRRNESAHG